MAIFAEAVLRTSALMTGTAKGLPLIFRPKLSHPVARFLCESWAICANYF